MRDLVHTVILSNNFLQTYNTYKYLSSNQSSTSMSKITTYDLLKYF